MTGVFQSYQRPSQPEPVEAAGPAARLRAWCHARPDREHEIIFNRLAMSAVGLCFLNASRLMGVQEWTWNAQWYDAYLIAYSLGFLAHIIAHPGVSHPRRVLGIVGDGIALAAPMYMGDASLACVYPILLWAIFGNGFRFGLRYLLFAAVVAFAMFSAVVCYTPFWRGQPSISVGLLAALVILPAYTSVLIRQLSEAKRLAEEANKAKTLFLASVSHELRTPLNAIIGLSDLLAETRLDEEQIDMSRVIGRSGRSLLSLINSILDISRMECGYPNARVDNVDILAFAADLRDMLAVQAQSKELRLCLHVGSSVPRFAGFNPRHVEEILVNLAGNAIKFTERGFVMVCISAAALDDHSIRLRFEVADTGIGIAPDATERIFDRFTQADETIIDRFGGTGLGLAIAKQLVEGMGGRIGVNSVVGSGSVFWFEFPCAASDMEAVPTAGGNVFLVSDDARLQSTARSVYSDMVMASDVATLVAGVRASKDAGARRPVVFVDLRSGAPVPEKFLRDVFEHLSGFEASLIGVFEPGAPEPSNDIKSMLASALAAPVDAGAFALGFEIGAIGRRKSDPRGAVARDAVVRISLRVLVAEDNRTNQLVIRKILERAGHDAVIVDDGQAAIEELSKGRFDLALMDINMPVLNGVDAAKLYQFSACDGPRTPIVALTADATAEASRRCLDAGMIACITKPIEPKNLVAWLDAFARDKVAGETPPTIVEPPAAAEAPEPTPIDDRALHELQSLGGDDFVSEIVDQFLGDAAGVLKNLHSAVADGDVQKFRDEAHALRSCAANVGAQKVYKLCLEWRAIDARELAIEGEMRIRRLEGEFERAREALTCFLRSEAA